MPGTFNLNLRACSSDNIRRVANSQQRKTFVYSNKKSQLNFDEMYQDLNPNITQLVQSNRLKLISMNSTRSKMLVNTTQIKLVSFMKSKPLTRKHHTISSTQGTYRPNIYSKEDDHKQNSQQIFDFNKLQQIVKSYERNTTKSRVQCRGALTQKILKLTGQNFYRKPQSLTIDLDNNFEQTERAKNYQGWKTQKSVRRRKHMFS